MKDVKSKEVWVTKKEIEEHLESFGRPGYDKALHSVKGRSKLSVALKELPINKSSKNSDS